MNSSPPRRAAVSSSRRQVCDPGGNRRQQQVADRVAQRVVDVLEPVEVEEKDGQLAAPTVGAGDRLTDTVGEQGAVGEAGQRVVMGHVHHALIGETALADLGLQSGIRAGELDGPRLDALLERVLRPAQRTLRGVALPVLPLDHAIGVTHDHEQHSVQHAQDRKHRQHHHPLRALDARQKRRDVVVDLEYRPNRPVGRLAHRNVGREQVGVLYDPLESAELVAVSQFAGDAAVAGALKAGVVALVLADLLGLGRE